MRARYQHVYPVGFQESAAPPTVGMQQRAEALIEERLAATEGLQSVALRVPLQLCRQPKRLRSVQIKVRNGPSPGLPGSQKRLVSRACDSGWLE